MDPKGLHKTPGPCSQNTPGRNGCGTALIPSPALPGQAAHRCTAAPRAAAGGPGPEARGGRAERRRGRGRAATPAQTHPEGARRGREEKGCSGRGRGGGGAPCPDSHSPPRAPPGRSSAAVPLRLSPRVSPPEAQRLASAHGAEEKSAREESVWRAEPRGWGGWNGRSRRRLGHHRHCRRRLLSATEAAAPPTTPSSRLPYRLLEE